MRNADSEFDRIAKEMFEAFIRRDPVQATSLGIHIHDSLLPSGTLQAKLEDIKIIKSYLRDFRRFSDEEISRERRFDKDLALGLHEAFAFL